MGEFKAVGIEHFLVHERLEKLHSDGDKGILSPENRAVSNTTDTGASKQWTLSNLFTFWK